MNGYKLVEDPEFNYLRVDPVPSYEQVEQFYLNEFYSGEYKKFNDSDLAVQEKDKEFFLLRWRFIYEQCHKYIGDLKGRTLLDIGCGYCQALLYFREQGMQVSGMEPSAEGCAYGISQGLSVIQLGFENHIHDFGEKFDVVTLLNVLEHLREPAEVLKRILKHYLSPNGMLVVEVPNEFNEFQVVADREYQLDQWWICPPGHINYFNVNSLKNLFELCGFEVVHIESSFPLEMFLLFGDVYVGKDALGKICHQKRVKFEQTLAQNGRFEVLQKLYQSLGELGLGRQITMYAIPKKS
ncbi:class I SAM-dependent methyltransferase [Chitinibacter sp. FCG-7]|uniref:Class I SAM-dependent methyltransferase n=1 Tax=Chitinibacter mangrovi TaxID=3153927 RepID=A0AAU7FAU6_9NEIS